MLVSDPCKNLIMRTIGIEIQSVNSWRFNRTNLSEVPVHILAERNESRLFDWGHKSKKKILQISFTCAVFKSVYNGCSFGPLTSILSITGNVTPLQKELYHLMWRSNYLAEKIDNMDWMLPNCLMNSLICEGVPGSWPPNWLQGNAITVNLSPNFCCKSWKPGYCFVKPQKQATECKTGSAKIFNREKETSHTVGNQGHFLGNSLKLDHFSIDILRCFPLPQAHLDSVDPVIPSIYDSCSEILKCHKPQKSKVG